MSAKLLAFAIVLLANVIGVTAAGPANIVPDYSYEENPQGLHEIKSFDYGFGGGVAEFYKMDNHSGRTCVHLLATGMDYSRVSTKALPNSRFSNITSFGFWFKHTQPVTSDLTPSIVIVVKIEGGPFSGYLLQVVQWNTWSSDNSGLRLQWAFFNRDSWHYYVIGSDYGVVSHVGMPNGVSLSQIQKAYDGTIVRVALAVGLASGTTTANVLVDDLTIIAK